MALQPPKDDISIHALREEGDSPDLEGHVPTNSISIHALREEGDGPTAVLARLSPISIHALREEGDHSCTPFPKYTQKFLSTPSARRATPAHRRGAEPVTISIHALREEGDGLFIKTYGIAEQFLSTPSARRATGLRPPAQYDHPISIHALREEGDPRQKPPRPPQKNFYPRPPRGGRPAITAICFRSVIFLSTPSARRATGVMSLIFKSWKFLSTPSARRATKPPPPGHDRLHISIHALREEGDRPSESRPWHLWNFYPRPPRGGRQQKQRQNLYFLINYTTFCTNLEEP